METAEFDQFSDEYYAMHKQNISITGEAPEYFAEYKIKLLGKLISKTGRNTKSILDFGSGTGNSIPFFQKYFTSSLLTCADVSQKSLDLGRSRFPNFGQNLLINGMNIATKSHAFDIVFSACVFHHIPHSEHVGWLHELRRVVHPSGVAMIFEHNPFNPLTVMAVNNCPFDANARLIRANQLARRCRAAGWTSTSIRYHLFFPRVLAALRPLEQRLEAIPLGAQYSVVAS